jgi:hypothetical protein
MPDAGEKFNVECHYGNPMSSCPVSNGFHISQLSLGARKKCWEWKGNIS